VLGLAIATAFNVDVISIYSQLSSDPELALQIANQAQAFAGEQGIPDSFDNSGESILSGTEIRSIRQLVKEDIASLESPLGVGWQLVTPSEMKVTDWLVKIAGWLVTSFGIMLGAPFWFDLLRKLVNIRNTGDRPQS
jgi:hypothetical protein